MAQLGYVAEMVGVMALLREQTADYVRQRNQFGVAIGAFQVVQHKLARMFVRHEQCQSLLLKAALTHRGTSEFVRNVTAAKATDPAGIRDLLVRQVTATVRWRESVAAMAAMGCDRFAELGAGRVLTGLMKRNAPDASAQAIGTPAEVEAFLKTL